ncbi:MAG: bifunctional folylpolyglutamate synthase/dihydrofolate synthase [Bacillaceae bacterium]
MNYRQAREWIHSRLQFGIKPGLERMNWMLEQLGNPEKKARYVHIAGTNGKGSTVTYMRNILEQAGYTVGAFTSPYIEHFNERISINGTMISEDQLIHLVQTIKPLAEQLEIETEYGVLTEFEAITVMMFYYFGEIHPVDLVLLEVGLGGRYDSTNVITPLVSVITNIGHDHMKILGDNLASIASEKAGIIKEGIPVVTAVQKEEALAVIEKEALDKGSNCYVLDKQFHFNEQNHTADGEVFSFKSVFSTYEDIILSMKGIHQIKNASTALMAIDLLKNEYDFQIEESHIYKGLRNATWQGRFEVVSKDPFVVVDGAHNEEGVTALVDTLQRYYSDKKKTIVTCMMNDKDVRKMMKMLEEVADELIFTSFDFYRAHDAETLASYSTFSNKTVISQVDDFIQVLEDRHDEMIIFTGSLYFISYVRGLLLNK